MMKGDIRRDNALEVMVLREFPFPIAGTFQDFVNEKEETTARYRALHWTVYQLMKTVVLVLLGQYLTYEPPEGQEHHMEALNKAIARLKLPHFSDWLTVLNSLSKRGRALKLDHFPEFYSAMEELNKVRVDVAEEMGITWRYKGLTLFEAFQGYRNHESHVYGNKEKMMKYMGEYLPYLYRILESFSFLRHYTLLKLEGDREEEPWRVEVLKGVKPERREIFYDEALDKAFGKGEVIIVSQDGRAQALFPLFYHRIEGEPLFLYEGHLFRDYDGEKERVICYLGNKGRKIFRNFDVGEILRGWFEKRKVKWFLEREDFVPRNLPMIANEYSKKIIEHLKEKDRYNPEVYLERERLISGLKKFIEEERGERLLLIKGGCGVGKSALMAHLCNLYLQDKESLHSLVFLRGGEIGGSLFETLMFKLGGRAQEFRTHLEFFEYYQHQSKGDTRFDERRFVLIVDAINEAKEFEKIFKEVISLAREGRRYSWLRIIGTMREEFFEVMRMKGRGHEEDPLYEVKDILYSLDSQEVYELQPFSLEEAEKVYEMRREKLKEASPHSSWQELPFSTRELLRNPFYLYLFMTAFRGKRAPLIEAEAELFDAYIGEMHKRFPELKGSLKMIIEKMIENSSSSLKNEDGYEIIERWQRITPDSNLRDKLTPLEIAIGSGILVKIPVREDYEYVFIHQGICEGLIYRKLRDEDETYNKESILRWVQRGFFWEYEGALVRVAWDLIEEGEGRRIYRH